MSFYKESRRHQESVDTIGAAAAAAATSFPHTDCATPIATATNNGTHSGLQKNTSPKFSRSHIVTRPSKRLKTIKEKNLAPCPSLSSPVSQ